MCQMRVSELSPGLLLGSDININNIKLFDKDTIITEDVLNVLKNKFESNSFINVYSFMELKPKISNDAIAASRYINFILDNLSSSLNIQLRSCEEIVNISNKLAEYLIDNRSILQELVMIKYMHNYTYSHCMNVAVISAQLGVELCLMEDEIKALVLGSLLHDLGKTAIPTAILDKPSKLSNDEFNIIKEHPTNGFKLLSTTDLDRRSFDIVIQHHEKLDGSGYPYHLVEDEIHPLSKIVAVADIFDAVTSERSYHKPMHPYNAFQLLTKDVKNHKLDGLIVEYLKSGIRMFPLNSYMQLSNGVCGFVVGYSDDNYTPIIYDIVHKKFYNIGELFNVEISCVA